MKIKEPWATINRGTSTIPQPKGEEEETDRSHLKMVIGNLTSLKSTHTTKLSFYNGPTPAETGKHSLITNHPDQPREQARMDVGRLDGVCIHNVRVCCP
jgi:hypothetical protein